MEPRELSDEDLTMLTGYYMPASPTAPAPKTSTMTTLVCSFCGKSRAEVQAMFTGNGANICGECVALCAEALAERHDPGPD
jgi:ClpX C4-type zinc finger